MTQEMPSRRNLRKNILDAAWALFLKQGYDKTTIDQIIRDAHSSRGAFYHHFRGKEDTLFQLAYYFDNTYKAWESRAAASVSAVDFLIEFDRYTMQNLEDSPYRGLFADLYGLEVRSNGPRHIINQDRTYYRLVSQVMKRGLESKELVSQLSFKELAEMYIVIERGTTYDWLLCQERYSLPQYSQRIIVPYLNSLRNPDWVCSLDCSSR